MSAAAENRLTVAVAQGPWAAHGPPASLEQACELAMDAGQAGARLLVLPEAFIPGYPNWIWTVPLADIDTWATRLRELSAAAVTVPSAATDRLGRIAERAGLQLVVGICERAAGGELYNTLLFFDAKGGVIGRQRQLLPAHAERLVWRAADGRSLGACPTPIGTLGGLIGRDNGLPLARYVLYAAGVQIYVAAGWPAGSAWLPALRHIAREGRVFVVSCGPAWQPAQLDGDSPTSIRKELSSPRAAIISPTGESITVSAHRDGMLVLGEINLADVTAVRLLDPDGPLARPDVFQVTILAPPSPLPYRVGAERPAAFLAADASRAPAATAL
jgi:nitrilase